ncbi:MAG: branched-chain amino acid ABC transporter permease [Rhizobiaceae bacterium]|nr:branched-chain amino acid ABC transporter permease [Rhizobiaceae bacterium]
MSELTATAGRQAVRPAAGTTGLVLAALLLVLAILFPMFVSRYWLALGITVLFWTSFSGSWNIIGGYAGQFSLGHAAFFAIGAYSSAWLYSVFGFPTLVGMIVGSAVAALMALCIGWIIFRYKLHGTYFAIGTLAMSEVLRVLAGALPWFGGNGGIPIPLAQERNWLLMQFQPMAFYYMFLAATVVIIALSAWIARNRFGYQLAAIRDSEDVAESIGISPTRLKLAAYVISAALAAPIGTLYSQYLMFVDPPTFFGLLVAIQVVLPAVIGGLGTAFGPLLGAIVLTFAIELSDRVALRPGASLLAYGAMLMVFSVLLPRGLWPLLSKMLPGATR